MQNDKRPEIESLLQWLFLLYLFLTKMNVNMYVILVSFTPIKGSFSSNLAGMGHMAKVDLIVHNILGSCFHWNVRREWL
jgi:hypothetical protein